MAAADVLVLPSHSEGLPTVLMEAGFARLPVVTTNAPGCIDLGADGRALLVPVGDASALAQALRTAVTQPGRMKVHAEKMLAYVRQYCSLEQNTQRLMEDYRALLSARRH
jgi:teichuronic acid biosynthesis glycosyltransferase TuaC